MRILLVGYYGHGNFGDDVLFKVAFSLLRERFPEAVIDVQSEARDPSYLDNVAGENIAIVRLGEERHYDLIFHGGGGTFFDFDNGGPIDFAINAAMQTFGLRRCTAAFEYLRTRTGRKSINGTRRIGVGIGVGTHRRSSQKLRHHLRVLHDFDFLAVRDEASVINARKLGVADPHLGTDLAFATRYWAADNAQSVDANSGPLVILRGWKHKHGRALQDRLVAELTFLKSEPKPSFLLLDRHDDSEWIDRLPREATHIYEPGQIDTVMRMLARATYWISARAHGAICGTLAGRPGIIVPIEPKLKYVGELLGKAARSWGDVTDKPIMACVDELSEVEPFEFDRQVSFNRGIVERILASALNTAASDAERRRTVSAGPEGCDTCAE